MSVTGVLTGILVMIGGFMTFLIMLQEGKGGGLASLGGTKAAGIEGVTNPIRRATAWMAGMFFVLAVVLATINRPTKTTDFYDDKKAAVETTAIEPANSVNQPVMTGAAVNVPPTVPTVSITPNPAAPGNIKPNEAITPVEAPKTTEAVKPVETPKTDAPKADAPKADAPKADSPKADSPKVEAPKADAPKADAPKTDPQKPTEPAKPETPKAETK